MRCKWGSALGVLVLSASASVYMPLANLRILRIQARADASSAAATRATSGLDACLLVVSKTLSLYSSFEPDRVNRALVQPDVAVVQYHAPAPRLSRVVP